MHVMRARVCGDPRGAFSLTEVVLALAVFSLAVVSLLGLLSVAMSTQRDSTMETTAANVASMIINARRAAPKGDLDGAVLPKIDEMTGSDPSSTAAQRTAVDLAGRKVADTDDQAQFLVEHRGWGYNDPDTPGLAHVHLRLIWPMELARRNPDRAESYEVFTMISER